MDLNVSEVAYEVVFRTSDYFTQAFTEVVGVYGLQKWRVDIYT